MKIAFIGVGKLGFPCAVALAMKGHDVYCYDNDSRLIEGYERGEVTPFEPNLPEQYNSCRKRMHYCGSIDDAGASSDHVFVAVPTPHAPMHDGSFPDDGVGRNFDNSIIRDCLVEVGRSIGKNAKDGRFRTILVISTTTPGTMVDDLGPATENAVGSPIGAGWTMVCNPHFIGRSTVGCCLLYPRLARRGGTRRATRHSDAPHPVTSAVRSRIARAPEGAPDEVDAKCTLPVRAPNRILGHSREGPDEWCSRS